VKYDGEAGASRVTIKSVSTACSCTVGDARAALAETAKDRARVNAGLVDCRPRAARGAPRIERNEHRKSGEWIEAIAWIQVSLGG